MGTVKTITLPDDLFEWLEKPSRRMRASRVETLRRLIERELVALEFDRLWEEQAKRNADLSNEEAERIAINAVRTVRGSR